MNSSSRPSSSARRLDRVLFWLRWPLLIGVALLGPLAGDALPAAPAYRAEGVLAGLLAGAAANVLLGLLALSRLVGDRPLGVLSALLDSAVAAIFLWAYGGATPPLLVLGALTVLAASLRFGWRGTALGVILLALTGLPALALLDSPSTALLINWALNLALLAVLGALGAALRGRGWASWGERLDEAQRLRVARERARAIYEMANALSATLDHRRVLEAAQGIGTLALHDELGPDVRLISAMLLFQGEDNLLRVITARGLTRADEAAAVPGRQGVLGLALKSSGPVFAGEGNLDPELRYFVAFQGAKSVLAIPLRAGFDVYGVMVFGADQPSAFSDDHVELMTAIGTQSTLALQNAVLYQNLLGEKERIVEVEEDARKKLSRDLHDGPTQTVAAIAMRVNYIRRLVQQQPQQALEELWRIEDLARRTTKEIRHMLFTLRPLVLESRGLLAALEQLAEKMRDTYDTTVLVEGAPDVERLLDPNAQGVLFYIVEEAVNNARKHARSSAIWVRLFTQNGLVIVEIEDNGVGFDVEAVGAGYEQRGSLGMINMRERAELIEGTLHIDSAPGQGTRIRVLIPQRAAAGPTAENGEAAPPLRLQSQRATSRPPDSAQPAPPASPPATRTPTGPLKPLPTQRTPTGPLKPLPARSRAKRTPPPTSDEPDSERK
ncbi:MAG: GAF domain-containing sensor histidine kinase [Anaerolineae bacterium]|nr:GAF domain-containing sensor histidine kinase [Anaerolineae bacterium]